MGQYNIRHGYNLYYKNKKINTHILSRKQTQALLRHNHLTCINKITNERMIVPINDITCVECIMV